MNPDEYDDDMSLDERLVYCIWSGKDEEVLQILYPQDLESCDKSNKFSGRTLLHVAAVSDNATIAEYLIDKGCKIDAVDNDGDTPLILACQHNYTEVIKILVQAKARVLISNNQGVNAAKIVLGDSKMNIHILDPFLKKVKEECSNDSVRTARKLIEIGCPLTRATRLRDPEVTKYMLDNGCDINESDSSLYDWTALHQALVFNDHKNAKLLIDRGADVNAEDVNGKGTVCYANCFESLEILLKKGARMVDDNGTLVAPGLFYCWERDVVEMLVERYNLRDFSIRDRRGTTLFHHIASNERFDPVEILQKHFDYRFNINQKNHEGSTLLINAVRAGSVQTVEFLLKKGADVNIVDRGRDPGIFYAVTPHIWKKNQVDREKILMLLLQYGADIQWTGRGHQGQEYFTLDYVLIHKHFVMAKMILARLALIEDLGGEIKDVYRRKIEDNAMCKKYFEFCKRTIEKLKGTVIKRRVTLYEFMTCSEETLLKFARSEEFVETAQSMMYHKRNSNLYYYNVLRKRVKKAAEVVDLRKNLFWFVNFLTPELQSNQIVIEKILEYIIYDMLCLMAKQPTFKCIIDNV